MTLPERRTQTQTRLETLRGGLKAAEALANGKACVYATGSFGRGEASSYSDLDLFILGKNNIDGTRQLKRLDEICIKADLIDVTRKLGIPEFSGDGQYLEHFTVSELTKTLGTQDDDVTNTFTARLLLLLESSPLLEEKVYEEVLGEVVVAYWRDYEDHRTDFMPAFFANDILRLWRTFCVNYEARTSRVPEDAKAKGKLKNYKLKHSRLLTCYSAILHLLAVYVVRRSVSPTDALAMVRLTPTQRLEWLLDRGELGGAHQTVRRLLDHYDNFLDVTNAEERDLVRRFMDREASQRYMEGAYRFGDLMYEALNQVGTGNPFFRLLVV